jgi:DNA recombination protein RmuC
MQIVLVLAAFVTGFAIAYAYFFTRTGKRTNESEIKLNDAEKQISTLTERLASSASVFQKTEEALKSEREKVLKLSTDYSRMETLNTSLTEKIAESQVQMQALNERFTKEFENLSNRILEENSKKFTEQNKTNLEQILSPLRDRIKDFEKKVDDSYKSESVERNSLKGEIKSLIELNKQISDEANNLAKALKGDTKKQGNWGEIILERILERSGLVKGQEYEVQVSTTNDTGRRFQPDVIIYLPENKHIIIDAKVSLVAYESMVNCANEDDIEKCLRDHITSVKNHIRILSEKEYQHLPGMNSPDFVLLFMPIESSFGFAVQADNELFAYAWDRKIVIVSPSTLLATLRTISSLWKQEKQTRNAIEIATMAGGLYDKFVNFHKDMTDVSSKLDAAKKSHDEALKKLSEGPGNIVKKIADLKKMGAKATKELPASILENADE